MPTLAFATINNASSVHDNCGLVTVANAINVPLSDTSGIAPYRPLVDRELAAVARLVGLAVVTFKVVCWADSDLELELDVASTAHPVAPGISPNVDRTRADRDAVWADRSKVCSMVCTAVFAASDAVLAVVVVERDVPHVVPSVTATFKEVMEVDAVAARATRRMLQ